MVKEKIQNGKVYLGIELGSTRIKACLIDDSYSPIAAGSYEWENKLENGYWTYDIEDVHTGVRKAFSSLASDVLTRYNVKLTKVASIGISGMMHGYLAFDKNMKLLTPFRTWRNTTTKEASEKLCDLFNFNIPLRWSISHLYQAILNNEPHVPEIAHITTLSGYVHYLLTGKLELGVCEASGMFPISGDDYDSTMLDKFTFLPECESLPFNIRDILPEVKLCGSTETTLTESGASFLDESGELQSGIPVCPPEGDAGTGMVATNSVKPRTGNISAGTSVFSMLVLDKPLCNMYPEVDVVMTPAGSPVAMIHSNNGCSELDAWVNVFGEFAKLCGADISKDTLYKTLYENALSGDDDCGEIISYNYLANEPVSGVENGKPVIFRTQSSSLTLANLFRSLLYSSVAVLKTGTDMLGEKEGVSADGFTAHGGLFKVKGVAQQLLANTLNVPICTSESAGEGGAWGMALLAAYSLNGNSLPLGQWLDEKVFKNVQTLILHPEANKADGFDKFFALYKSELPALNAF